MEIRRGGDGPQRGPVLHIVVVGFHHKKGCQVRKGPVPAPGRSGVRAPPTPTPFRSAQTTLQCPRPSAPELDSSLLILALTLPEAHPARSLFSPPPENCILSSGGVMCRYVGVGRYLGSSMESEEGIDGRPTLFLIHLCLR